MGSIEPNSVIVASYLMIDEAKKLLKVRCPQTVSCVDIVTFVTRDTASKLGGIKYDVQSSRRDGRVSLKPDPKFTTPFFNLQQLRKSFERKGLSVEEMVTLFGAHSIGISHCSFLTQRLYSFNATNTEDPLLDSRFASI